MKRLLLNSSFLLFSLAAFGQDSVIFNNGYKAFVKVMEVNSRTIKYAENAASGIEIREKYRSDINYIVYANGMKETMGAAAPPPDAKKVMEAEIVDVRPPEDKTTRLYGKNIIGVNAFEFFFTNFGAYYERFFLKNRLSVKIPVSFGLGGKPVLTNYSNTYGSLATIQNKNYAVGLELNAYLPEAGKSNFYVGLSGQVGSFNYYDYTNYYGNSTYLQIMHEGRMYSFMFHLGGNIGLSDHILIGSKIGAGFKYEETIFVDYTKPRVQIDLNLGYRF